MKSMKLMVVAAALVALVVGPTMAEEKASRVYRAIKPYWWSSPAMKCYKPGDNGVHWCRAGGWEIHRLFNRGENSIAALGIAGYKPGTGRANVTVRTNFGDRDVTFACLGQAQPLAVKRERIESQAAIAVFDYWVWAPRAKIDECLLNPIKMTVDGQIYRLDTSLLRKAVANAIARAG